MPTEEHRRSHSNLAHKLNNKAATCIAAGEYDNAVGMLVKALRMTETTILLGGEDDKERQQPCECHLCSLESCMQYSQWKQQSCQDKGPRSSPQHGAAAGSMLGPADVEASEHGGYVYRDPIRLPSIPVAEGHNMGLILPLVATFNLALAHHLSALNESKVSRLKWQAVLKLYELAYMLQVDDGDTEDDWHRVDSVHFTIVITNNLAEIHRAIENHTKHQMCLQHLLSTIMFVVDCEQTRKQIGEMDGFFQNTSQLILQKNSAEAA